MSTAPFLPSNSSNTNTSPYLWYLLSVKVSFDFSTRIVRRTGGLESGVAAKLSPPAMFLSTAMLAMFVLPAKLLGWAEDAYGGRSGLNGPKAVVAGMEMSSINRSSSDSSPFKAGRGPRIGSETTFHGHNNGIIHSATSRFGCPFP